MALVPRQPLRLPARHLLRARRYATVRPVTLVGEPPKSPQTAPPPTVTAPSALDALVLSELRSTPTTSLPPLIQQYVDNAGYVLDIPLPYESRPSDERRLKEDEDDGVYLVAHAAQHDDRYKVSLCSGFVLNVPASEDSAKTGSVLATCAHTLEEMRRSPLVSPHLDSPPRSPKTLTSGFNVGFKSGSYILSHPSRSGDAPSFHPVASVLSSLHRPDLLVLSASASTSTAPLTRSLPVSPYPVPPGAAIRAHFVVDKEPEEPGWVPWIGGMWRKWVKGKVLGYRDFAGREAKPGTYDALSHLFFEPLPTPGSSGGPIIDEESGAVVGVILGTQMDSRIEGVRGWGVPAETIFEMFSLPGMKFRRENR